MPMTYYEGAHVQNMCFMKVMGPSIVVPCNRIAELGLSERKKEGMKVSTVRREYLHFIFC